LIVVLNRELGLSHGKIATLLRDWFGLSVRPSAVKRRDLTCYTILYIGKATEAPADPRPHS